MTRVKNGTVMRYRISPYRYAEHFEWYKTVLINGWLVDEREVRQLIKAIYNNRKITMDLFVTITDGEFDAHLYIETKGWEMNTKKRKTL